MPRMDSEVPFTHRNLDETVNNGSDPYGVAPVQDQTVDAQNQAIRRLYNRHGNPHKADYHVAAVERDAVELARRRALSDEYPLTDGDTLRRSYEPALRMMRLRLPLRAAVIDDLMGRVQTGLNRFRELRREVEREDQEYNEESRRADAWIDLYIEEMRKRRDLETAPRDEEIARLGEELTGYRKQVAEARVRVGLPVPLWDLATDDPDSAKLEAVAETRKLETGASVEIANVPVDPAVAQSMFSRMGLGRFLPKNLAAPASRVIAPSETSAALGAGLSVTPHPSVLAPPVALEDDAPPARKFEAPASFRVEFPLAEAQEQEQPIEAVAVRQGLLYDSPAAQGLEHAKPRGLQAARLIALLACGSIFGLSLGVLIGVIDVRMLSIRPLAVAIPAVIVIILGVSIFWTLGRIVTGVFGLWSEEHYLGRLNLYAEDPGKVGEWLQKSAWCTLLVAIVIAVLLIGIECQVERYGVLGVLLNKSQNASIVAGHGGGAEGQGPSDLVIICLVMMVSVPFVIHHAVEAWLEVRKRTINQRMMDIKISDMNRSARDIQRARTDKLDAAYTTWLASRTEERETTAQYASAAERSVDVVSPIGERVLDQPLPQNASTVSAVETEDAVAPEVGPTLTVGASMHAGKNTLYIAPSPHVLTPEEVEARVMLSVASQQARDVWSRRRVAMAKRNEAIAWIDDRIAAHETMRRAERADMEGANRSRLEDAYADYAGSVRAFDEAYKREMIALEKLIKGGWLFRLWAWTLQRPMPNVPDFDVRYAGDEHLKSDSSASNGSVNRQ